MKPFTIEIVPHPTDPDRATLRTHCGKSVPCSVPLERHVPVEEWQKIKHAWAWNGQLGDACNVRPSFLCRRDGCDIHFTVNLGEPLKHE